MFYSLRLYWRDKWIFIPFLLICILQFFIWLTLFRSIHPTTEQLFLHYNVILGVDYVGEWWKLYLLPLGGLAILFLNFVLSFIFYRADRLAARVLAVLGTVIHIFLITATILAVRLNG